MVQALMSSVSGIDAAQKDIGNISADLANLRTTAYKGSRTIFKDILSETIQGATAPTETLGGRNPIQAGLGVQVAATDVNETDAGMQSTGRTLDCALDGTSTYFLVSDGDSMHYTQDGAFTLDANKYLIHKASGYRLAGWSGTAGVIDNTQQVMPSSFLQVPIGSQSAQTTTKVVVNGNLSQAALSTDTASISNAVYDGLGNAHTLVYNFTNHQAPPQGTAPTGAVSSWDWTITENGTTIGSSSTGNNQRIYFDGNGAVVNAATMGSFTVPATPNTAQFIVQANFSGIKQLSSPSQLVANSADGSAPGTLSDFNIMPDGKVIGKYSSGINVTLGQIAVAAFSNPAGMAREGNNLWGDTVNSGTPKVVVAGENGSGTISSGFLKLSNVDISEKFTNMIMTSRWAHANTKVATIVDEALARVLEMKRS